jgi:hypothetical protein
MNNETKTRHGYGRYQSPMTENAIEAKSDSNDEGPLENLPPGRSLDFERGKYFGTDQEKAE